MRVLIGAVTSDAHWFNCERAGRLRAEAEVKRLREAAAAPLVLLAAGQAAVSDWAPNSLIGPGSFVAVGLGRECAYELYADSVGWEVSTRGLPGGRRRAEGTTPDIAAAKLAAEAAVVELARKEPTNEP